MKRTFSPNRYELVWTPVRGRYAGKQCRASYFTNLLQLLRRKREVELEGAIKVRAARYGLNAALFP